MSQGMKKQFQLNLLLNNKSLIKTQIELFHIYTHPSIVILVQSNTEYWETCFKITQCTRIRAIEIMLLCSQVFKDCVIIERLFLEPAKPRALKQHPKCL